MPLSLALALSSDFISAQDTTLGLGQKMAELAGLIIGGIILTALFDECISIISHVNSGMHCSDVY